MKTVACIGMAVADLTVGPVENFSFNVDVTLVDKLTVTPGGDAGNVALNLLNLDVPVSLYGKIGKDMFGNHLKQIYSKSGMDISGIKISDNESTATCVTLVDHTGDRVFLYHGGATETLNINDIDLNTIYNKDIVHASGFYLLPALEEDGLTEIFSTAQAKGRITTLDVGWDNQNRWFDLIKPVLPHLDYFIPTDNEASKITNKTKVEDMAEVLLSAGVKNVVIKMGADGAYAHNGTVGKIISGLKAKKVVDTTGAGDAFVAGFLSAIARDYDIFQAVKCANIAGSITVQEYGTTGKVKTFKQLGGEN